MVNHKADQAIVDEDDGALGDLLGKVQVVKGDVAGVAVEVIASGLGRDDKLVASLDGDLLAVLQKAGTNLGTLGVKKNSNGDAELLGNVAHLLDHLTVIVVAAVREVEASDVHAVQDELAQNLLVLGSRTHGAYDLGLLGKSHLEPLSRMETPI